MNKALDSPRVSVIINAYNCSMYIGEAVESMLSQTFERLEVIVIDDGSTDDTAEVVLAAAKGDPRLRLILAAHGGIPAALNLGLTEARGDLIAKMDADDVAAPERVERQVAEFDADSGLVLLGAEVELISEQGVPLGVRGHAASHEEIRRRLLQGDGGALTHPVVMFRREAAQKLGGYDERFHTTQDLDLFLRLSEEGTVRNLPDVLLKWRQHPKSINRTKSKTWAEMKRLAISKTIERIGVERYLCELFPASIQFGFPGEPLELARFALKRGRRDAAEHFFRLAKSGENGRVAKEELIELALLKSWRKIRNFLRGF